ncbi:MAG: efflux RND transporter periplasmic adaptor subunit [Muribaculaceae bacterium]|nr:efflux RND transporter periplasmic adaptor subunit [Muribaculaceae bacterium]
MKSKRTTYAMALAAMTAVLAGTATTACSNSDKPTQSGPLKVEVKVAGSGTSADGARTYSGTVESGETSTVSFNVPGTIQKMYVEVGQKVAKGQLLATVKGADLQNASNIAQAELAEAQDAYRRLKKLHDANALPEIKWVEVQQKLKQAQNAAAIASRGVGDASLHSPISGYVSAKLADEGQTVIAAQPVLTIVSLSDMQVAISVPEDEIGAFKEGSTATVTFDGVDSLKTTGRLRQKAVVADPLTRSYSVKYDIPSTNGKILPGMIGTVSVTAAADTTASSAPGRFELPSQAVLLAADNTQFVWVVKNGRAERRTVTAEQFSDNGVAVSRGLQKGDSVIVAGMQKVGTGTAVTTR